MPKELLEVEGLTKLYRRGKVRANDGIDLRVEQGEIFGLLGPNGAGKTTLVRQVVGLLRPTEGSIRLFAQDVVRHPERAPEHLAYFGQRPSTLDALRPAEALEATGRLRGMAPALARKAAHEWIDRLGLAGDAKRYIKKLSGGQQKLVAFALCLIGDRPLLVLDEPTNDLDPLNRRLLWDILRERRDQGTSVLLVTHNVHEAEQVLDRVAVVDGGRVRVQGRVTDLKRRVDDRLRVDIWPSSQSPALRGALDQFGDVAEADGYFRLLVRRDDVHRVLAELTARRSEVEEFRVVPPSLEDVYVAQSRGEIA